MWMEGQEANLASVEEEDLEQLENEGPGVNGIDERRMLPILLQVSFVVGATCMLLLQRRLVLEVTGSDVVASVFLAVFAFLYVATLACMIYAAFKDPGQLDDDAGHKFPDRSHKNFQYARRIRRFDHYCRWIMNCIGLLNHREFILMLIGFVSIAAAGSAVDFWLLVVRFWRKEWATEISLMLHLVYSLAFAYYVVPIFRLHVTFVSRNELANEWKDDKYYVVDDLVTGEPVWVGELDEEEFNERFDTFRYDPSRNPYDAGCAQNCMSFWCTPRWPKEQLGNF